MVFKFTNDLSLNEARLKRVIKKSKTFDNKIVFVNGFGASGKTMVSPIISSMHNVENLVFPYEIQWVSSFLYSEQIEEDAYVEFLKQYADQTIYNQLMGRNSNFRPSDISSILQSKKKIKYIRRIFEKGDHYVVDKIKTENPILNFTTSHLTFFINEIGKAYGKRVLFIETIRDPMYMFVQAKINHKQTHLGNREKHFTFETFQGNERAFFFDYFTRNKNFDYSKENNINEDIVIYLEKIFNFYFKLNFDKIDMNGGKVIFLPFEKFVLNPDIWINEILKILKIKKTKILESELKKQNVPRKFLQDGYYRSVYERFGYKPTKIKFNSFVEADKHYKETVTLEFTNKNNKIDKDLFKRLEKLSNDYREWIKKFNNIISYG
tara:strand:+ start:274 stop:1410 length:1137 start_codon:yes stop_codon:yes gene_type:complete